MQGRLLATVIGYLCPLQNEPAADGDYTQSDDFSPVGTSASMEWPGGATVQEFEMLMYFLNTNQSKFSI